LGIGGNFRAALAELSKLYRDSEGEPSLTTTIFGAIFYLCLTSLAGPIIPIIKILMYVNDRKTAESNIADCTSFIKRLTDYHEFTQYIEQHGHDLDLVKLTAQGGVFYNNAYANAVLNGTQEEYFGVEEKSKMLKKEPKGEALAESL
jgi:hypothetical protein